MPHVDAHTAGTISWADFVSTDLEAASAFYRGLFGWETEDMPMPDGAGTYRFFRLGGRDAAAGGTMPAQMAAQEGMHSHWNVWVAGNADEVAEKAAAAGGRVLMPPTTMGPSGRMAMVADPGGAAIGVWQADQHIGAGVVDEPGAMTWWEVNTRAHWMTYFAVRDTDDAARRATELGGSVGAPPFDTAFGRIAVLADPSGGHFSVITPSPAAG